MLPILTATRYVVPLREGGSLPAVLETDGRDLYVAKFRGAGQGPRALIAELIVGQLGRALNLPVPELALIDVDAAFGRLEPDEEIQDILEGSRGLNLGLRFLPGAFTFDPLAEPAMAPELAADVVWLDALTMNVDRTPRNPNLLVWEGRHWLIDHGAALYFHHNWAAARVDKVRAPFEAIASHVLLSIASDIQRADERLAPLITADVLSEVLGSIPDAWLMDDTRGPSPHASGAAAREAYRSWFLGRLQAPRRFAEAAEEARMRSGGPAGPLGYRR